MHRLPIQQLLKEYKTSDSHEELSRQRIVDFISEHPDCFERTCMPGHVTGSVWLLNREGTHVLLTHHRKLGLWLQLGGHCDGQTNIIDVAMREAHEESGINAIELVREGIFDVDVHPIPAWKNEPEHLHYDIGFLMRVRDDSPYVVSDESNDLKWFDQNRDVFPFNEVNMRRMFDKWCDYNGETSTLGSFFKNNN